MDSELLIKLEQAANHIQPLPVSASKVAELVGQGEVDTKQLTEVVAMDQRLTLGVLNAANSAFHRPVVPITDVRQAIVRVGVGYVLCLSLAATQKRLLKRAIPEYEAEEGALWEESVRASIAAQQICAKRREAVGGHTAALLHNVGKVVFCQFMSQEDVGKVKEAEQEGQSRAQAELATLGISYAEVGAMVARHWKLPTFIAEAVAAHAHPAEDADLTTMVCHISAGIAQSVRNEAWIETIEPHAIEKCQVNTDDLIAIQYTMENEFDEMTAKLAA